MTLRLYVLLCAGVSKPGGDGSIVELHTGDTGPAQEPDRKRHRSSLYLPVRLPTRSFAFPPSNDLF
jgi:hypothetical protein